MVKKLKVWQLILILIIVIGGFVLFVGLVSGWFADKRAEIDAEYASNDNCEYMELSASEYEELIREKKSFVVFVDQGGCTTADRLRGFVADYMKEKGFKVYKMMFEKMEETSLHDFVKYYPAVAVVSSGEVIGWLRADSDDDAPAYNNYDDFVNWIDKYLK